MANIAENLQVILKEKNDLKNSINTKNAGAITDSTPFSAYPNSISAIETRTLDMSDRVVSDCFELKDYTDSEFTVGKCIKEISIPTNVTSFGNKCFFNCLCLSAITIPDSVTSIGMDCFFNCSSLTGITIHDAVTSLGSYCFVNCSDLTYAIIGNSVTSISYRCFDGCSSLTSVTIGNSVTLIEESCFESCSSLTSVICKATTPPTLDSRAFKSTPSTMVIYVPEESIDAYKSATNWSKYADNIQAIA